MWKSASVVFEYVRSKEGYNNRIQELRGVEALPRRYPGIVRNNTKGRATRFLDYECYEPMAIKVMTEIGLTTAVAHAIGRIGMVHRLGRMEVGEASVVIVTTEGARHRGLSAGELVRTASDTLGGRGGGKDDIAQGGGQDATKVADALAAVEWRVGELAG